MALLVTKIGGNSMEQGFRYDLEGYVDWDKMKIRIMAQAYSVDNDLFPTEIIITLICPEADQKPTLQSLSPFLATHHGNIWSKSPSAVRLFFMRRCQTLMACMRETDTLLVALDAALQVVTISVAAPY